MGTEEIAGGRMKMEEWVTWILFGRDVVVCDNCSGSINNQRVHMYVNVDNEVEEVLCEECYKSRRK